MTMLWSDLDPIDRTRTSNTPPTPRARLDRTEILRVRFSTQRTFALRRRDVVRAVYVYFFFFSPHEPPVDNRRVHLSSVKPEAWGEQGTRRLIIMKPSLRATQDGGVRHIAAAAPRRVVQTVNSARCARTCAPRKTSRTILLRWFREIDLHWKAHFVFLSWPFPAVIRLSRIVVSRRSYFNELSEINFPRFFFLVLMLM